MIPARPPLTTAQIGVCSCGAFLIYNFFFKGKRFLCLSCGALYIDAPRIQESTREGESRLAALETEFMINAGRKLFCIGMNRNDCPLCNGPDEQEHILHATNREWMECNDALKWLSDRTGREFGIVNGDLGHAAELVAAARHHILHASETGDTLQPAP
jgi:hypothetical protein